MSTDVASANCAVMHPGHAASWRTLAALNDTTPHDSKYHRLVEYTLILRRLLEGHSPVSFEGQFYCVKGLMLTPRVAQELFPGILVSGSSDAGMSAARAVGATAVKYP